MEIEKAVQERYSNAALAYEPGLCCPVDYDPSFLKVIPGEVLERDYGCGDPVSHVRPGETVLDLGSGGGKVCFVAAQIVGPTGHVIGVDLNDDMLGLARRAQPEVAAQLGYDNVEFRKGRIEELDLDLSLVEAHLSGAPIASADDLSDFQQQLEGWRRERPLVEDESVDVVVSNCVLNLVRPEAKRRMFGEIHRVLKPGGRAIISDIVTDRDVPPELLEQAELWSGCYAGALREDAFVQAFVDAGLQGVHVLRREHDRWEEISGVTFRSVTVAAYRAPEPLDEPVTAVYKGPFEKVKLDSGETLERGAPVLVSAYTAAALVREPYADSVLLSGFEEASARTAAPACGPSCSC